MLASSQSPQNQGHATKRLLLAIVATVIIVVALVAFLGYFLGLENCFGGCGRNKGVQISVSGVPSCSSVNSTCRIKLINTGTNVGHAVSCSFNSSYATQTTNNLRGILSSTPGGAASMIAVEAGTSVTVYCVGESLPPSVVEKGNMATGTVGFAEEGEQVNFKSVWR